MKWKPILRIIGVILIGAGVFALLYLSFYDTNNTVQKVPQAVVIVNNSSSSRWVRFQAGLEQAADDFGISLNYAVTGEFSSIYREKQTIQRESDKADAVIVQLVDTSDTIDLINELCRDKVLALVDTDAPAEAGDNYASITADNMSIGSELANIACTESGLKIGVLTGNQKMSSMQERYRMFKARAEKLGAEVIWTISNPVHLSSTQTEDPADIIVALDNDSLEAAVDVLMQENSTIPLYGVGCSDKTIYYLDRGMIGAMIVPDDFRMGYQAVREVAARLDAPNIPMAHHVVPYTRITKENIYDSENAALLFPIIN